MASHRLLAPKPIIDPVQFQYSSNQAIPLPLKTGSSDLTQSSMLSLATTDGTDSNSNFTPSTTSSSLHFGNASSAFDLAVNNSQSSTMMIAPPTETEGGNQAPTTTTVPTTATSSQQQWANFNDGLVPRSPFQSPSKPASSSSVQLTPSQKRSANGEIKYSTSPERPYPYPVTRAPTGSRSRALSTDSHANRIAEISLQLRARLSWAAAKVEHDRKSSTIGSGQASPIKTTTAPFPPRWSPASQMSLPSTQDGSLVTPDFTAELLMTAAGLTNGQNGSSRSSHNGLNEVRKKSHRSSLSQGSLPHWGSFNPPIHKPTQVRRLAPPADIVAGKGTQPRRRPNPNSHYPPDHHNAKYNPVPSLSQQSSNSSTLNAQLIPGTPPVSESPFQLPASISTSTGKSALGKHRTPTQKALMEQDAVETLLFMGSPENSGYYNNSNSRSKLQQSMNNSRQLSRVTSISSSQDLGSGNSNSNGTDNGQTGAGLGLDLGFGSRTRDPQQAKRVTFVDNMTEGPHLSYPILSRPGLEHAGDEIDRMLDEINEESDGENEFDWFAHMAAKSDGDTLMPQDSSSQASQAQFILPATYQYQG
ncbi:hypothetical protein FQN57_006054 [Myotisia sp. PD_48]|nr:hypothetical protein FQN57_006054 [Myotisia sp. PD_48]